MLLICLSVNAVRPISTYGHQMPQTSSNPAPRHATGTPSSSSSPNNAQGSKHDPIDIESIPEKKSSKNHHQGHGSRTDPIQISDLGERTRPIQISDSQHHSSTSPVRYSQTSKSPVSDTAAGHSLTQKHSLYASKKRTYGKSTVTGIQQGSSSTSKRGRKGKKSGTQLIDQWLNFKPPSPPKNM